MYNSIQGILTAVGASKLYLENQGLEFEIEVSLQSISTLPEIGTPIRVYTYLYHREDTMKLYGFLNVQERQLFLDLLKVDGVGPKQALRILSGTTVDAFIRILDAEDVRALTRIPGLGIKTAQKVLFSLKGKIQRPGDAASLPTERDLEAALVEMGFDAAKVSEGLRKALNECREQGLVGEYLEREALRRAIVWMSGA